jgi:hypothetical protein
VSQVVALDVCDHFVLVDCCKLRATPLSRQEFLGLDSYFVSQSA